MKLQEVARAICAADPLAPEPDTHIYIGVKAARAWEARIPMARAAIKALREPTKEMLDAGMAEEGVDLASEYRAMIDAILSEGE